MFVGCVTLAAGLLLIAGPGRLSGLLGLEGQEPALRVIGASDLVLVPGLLRGRPRGPWMIRRAPRKHGHPPNQRGVAPQSSSPEGLNGGAGLLLGLTVVDGATGLALRRAGS